MTVKTFKMSIAVIAQREGFSQTKSNIRRYTVTPLNLWLDLSALLVNGFRDVEDGQNI